MSWLPENTLLGDLKIDETFVEYDGPRVFSCRSLTDQIYLAAWAEEGGDADNWLYVPLSLARLNMVRSGGMTLRNAFVRPEGFVFSVRMPHDIEEACDAEPIRPSQIDDSWLPGGDFRLDLPTHTLPVAEGEDDIERRVRQESRARLRLRVKLPEYTRSEAPTRKIGELLVLTQMVYDNIGLALLEDDPPQRGRVPERVTAETASDLVALSAASFVLEIAAGKLDDLLGDSVFADVTKELISLLGVGLEHDALVEGLSKLRPRGAKSFRNFVKGLASTGGDVTVAAAGQNLPYTRQVLTADVLDSMVIVLNNLVPDEAAEIRGRMRLRALDIDRKTFTLLDESDNTSYEGKLADRALYEAGRASINSEYDVVISEFALLDEVIGERRPRYVLDQLTEADPDVAPVTTTRALVDAGPDLAKGDS